MLDYEIRQMYEDMELRLIKSMKKNLQLHLDEEDITGFKYPQWQVLKLRELKRYQRQNKDIVGYKTKGFSTKVSEYLKNEFNEGSYNAFKQQKEAMGDKYKANKRLNNSFFKINDKKVNSLIKSVNNDLSVANKAILRMTNDQYRKIIFQSQFYIANGVMTPKQAIDKANEEFLRRGLNVIQYKDGKRVNIASYSQMAVRTAGQRATLMGEGEVRKEYKQHLIQISAHGTSCELCIPWQGKVLIDDVYSGGSKKDGKYTLLSQAMEEGLFHPNCRHGISTYFGGKDDISDIEASFANGKDGSESDAAYLEDMNYINRKIKEYERLETGSLDETNVKTYRNKRKEWEGKKKDIEKKQLVIREYKPAKYLDGTANKMSLWDKVKQNPDKYKELIPNDSGARKLTDSGDNRIGDLMLKEIAKEQGFDALPKVVSSEEMDKLIENGAEPIYRGLQDIKYCDDFINGEYYTGLGMYGNGNYFVGNTTRQFDDKIGQFKTHDGLELATAYAGNNEKGGIVRAVLDPKAKVIDFNIIDDADTGIYYNDKSINEIFEGEKNQYGVLIKPTEIDRTIQNILHYDEGRWAAYAGYDAIYIPSLNYYCVLNRSAVIVDKNIISLKKEGENISAIIGNGTKRTFNK